MIWVSTSIKVIHLMAKNKSKDFDDLFGEDNDAKPVSEFDQLLNGSIVSARGLMTGDRFRGEVLAISGQEAFLSTGTPTDAVMPFALSAKQEAPKVGDQIDVMVVRSRDGEIVVRPVGSRGGDVEADSLQDAMEMEIPVDGLVTEAVNGGFKVKVQDHKAFCPISQMDWRVANANDYVDKKYKFLITRMERGRDLVVSRRKLLEQERAGTEADFQQSAQIGEVYDGKIFRIEKYGAFVRLENGVDGLIPISELSYGRIGHPQEVVNLDQTVQVKLMRMEKSQEGTNERLKMSFSLKQGGGVIDPWTTIESDYPVGSVVDGKVEHKETFGLFVNLGMGVTGLLPRSVWRDSTENVENKKRGDVIKVKIEKIDTDNRKMSFSLPSGGEDEANSNWQEHANAKSGSSNFGSMADLFKDLKGKR